jgi:tryptophan synthase alpha chain
VATKIWLKSWTVWGSLMTLEHNRIVRRLNQRGGLVPYLTAGDGGLDYTLDCLRACAAADVALVELGVPFSDPMADGPLLQAAAQRSLENGTDLKGILDVVRRFRMESDLPIALFTYANPLYRMGLPEAALALKSAGVDGVLVPDLPLEESECMREAMNAEGLTLTLFVAPSTSSERLDRIAALSQGFLYVIGRMGVTGRSTEAGSSEALLERVKTRSQCPVGLGFGLRSPEQVATALKSADLAIVGSALVDHLHQSGYADEACVDFLNHLMSESTS